MQVRSDSGPHLLSESRYRDDAGNPASIWPGFSFHRLTITTQCRGTLAYSELLTGIGRGRLCERALGRVLGRKASNSILAQSGSFLVCSAMAGLLRCSQHSPTTPSTLHPDRLKRDIEAELELYG